MGADTPEWLTRTRDVCFGTLPNGLPDTYGWMTLVMSPLSMLGGILVLWGAGIVADIRTLRLSRAGTVVLLVLFGVPMAEVMWVGHKTGKALSAMEPLPDNTVTENLPADYPRLTKPAADFSLVNQRGETVTKSTLQGKITVVTFAYAHCATVCPLVIKTLNDSMARLQRPDVTGVVVTLDPYRDTPGSLPGLAETWELNSQTHLLSGEPETVNQMLKAYNVATDRDENTGEIAHLAIFYVLDEAGRLVYAFNNPSGKWLDEAVTKPTYSTVN
jgi:protein SCO1/2